MEGRFLLRLPPACCCTPRTAERAPRQLPQLIPRRPRRALVHSLAILVNSDRECRTDLRRPAHIGVLLRRWICVKQNYDAVFVALVEHCGRIHHALPGAAALFRIDGYLHFRLLLRCQLSYQVTGSAFTPYISESVLNSSSSTGTARRNLGMRCSSASNRTCISILAKG